jgi:hypothetical protein
MPNLQLLFLFSLSSTVFFLLLAVDTRPTSPYTGLGVAAGEGETCGVVPKSAVHPPPGALAYPPARVQAQLQIRSRSFASGISLCVEKMGACWLRAPSEPERKPRNVASRCKARPTRSRNGQSGYLLVTANARDWHKWKGEIAYANVVALFEDLKSRPVPAQ